MHEISGRLVNLLGAAALTLSDRQLAAATDSAPTSPSAASALITLSDHEGIGITELSQHIGISQPAAARMVQSLESGGFVSRRPGSEDHRSTELKLTAKGRTRVREILDAREKAIADLLQDMPRAEMEALTRILERLLSHPAVHAEASADVLCRLCDRRTCRTEGAVCPVSHGAGKHQRAEP